MSLFSTAVGQSKGIWTGDDISFSKANSADWTSAQNQDRITDSIWITRRNDQGLINYKLESTYAYNTSPLKTKWAMGTTSNLSTLSFRDWENAVGSNPPGSVNKDMVLFIEKGGDSIYIDIKFTKWSSGGTGGGFTYTRSTDCRSFTSVTASSCDSMVSPSKRHVWRTSGIYTDTLTNANSCDSILTINATIHSQDTGFIFKSGCGSYILPWSKREVTKTGTYHDTLTKGTVCGRDSILEAKIFIYPVPTKDYDVTGCDSFVSPSGKYVWTKSGKYDDVLKSSKTCDTAVTVNLTIYASSHTSYKTATCDSFVSVGNRVYRTTGMYSDTLQTYTGCDSVINVDLTVNNSSFTKISPIVCRATYLSPSGKYTWNTTGVYYDTLQTTSSCDSVLEIHLGIAPKLNTIKIESCEPWSSPSGKYVYTVSAVYYDTIPAGSDCDSVLTINFTKLETSSETKVVLAAINKFNSPSGKYVWTSDGTYKDTIPNVAGCDSFITFDIKIQSFSLDITQNGNELTAVADGVNYQWLDCDNGFAKVPGETSKKYDVTKKGTYAVELGNQWNTDTSSCIEMNLGIRNNMPADVLIYPNPNQGRFMLDLGSIVDDVQFVSVTDVNGKLLYMNVSVTKTMDIDLRDQISSGVYFIRIVGSDFSYNTSAVVE